MEATWWTQPDQLDEDQRKVVALPPTGDHLIVGPAGSGKTNLLLLRAGYLHKLGRQNIALLTFNRVLKEFLALGTTATPFDTNKIQTYIGWGAHLLRQNGEQLERSNDFEAIRQQITKGLSEMSPQGISENQFDCILLDEAQDYTADEIRMFRRFCKQIFAVGDDRQRIYRAEGALDVLEEICGPPKPLRFNYRSGLKICRVADGIRNELDSENGLEASAQYDEQKYPSAVSWFKEISLEEQVVRAVQEISTQLRAYQEGIIGVLAPKRGTVTEISKHMAAADVEFQAQLQQYSTGYAKIDPNRRVVITTIHGAKGLEFRAVHLMAMDTVKKFPLQKKLAYTGVTRAKTSLCVYSDGTLPGYFEQALTSVEPKDVPPPNLSELFSE